MRTGVIGLGLIGGSVLRGLGARGYDADPAARAAAAAEGFDVVEELAGLDGCELVIVAVPPGRTAEVAAAALAALPGAAVADTASVKAPVLAALAGEERFVGAHPLAGAETAGWDASAAEVLEGALWAVCPPAAAGSLEPACRLAAAVDGLSGRLLACTAAAHDAALARTSHAPHLVAQALPGGGGLLAALSGSALRDMTRVARADPGLWLEILSLNREEVLAALDELSDRLDGLRSALASDDREALAAGWARAAAALAAVDGARWAEPAWHEEAVEDGWAGLLALGAEGRAVRRLRAGDGGALVAEVAR